MNIADYIREFLVKNPKGVYTYQVAQYCIRKNAFFITDDINKSVSGQLSKMRERGEVTYIKEFNRYKWFKK